jgi:hypothetical protein
LNGVSVLGFQRIYCDYTSVLPLRAVGGGANMLVKVLMVASFHPLPRNVPRLLLISPFYIFSWKRGKNGRGQMTMLVAEMTTPPAWLQ